MSGGKVTTIKASDAFRVGVEVGNPAEIEFALSGAGDLSIEMLTYLAGKLVLGVTVLGLTASDALAWALGIPTHGGACRVCGCTDDRACLEPGYGSCSWVEEDLCSRCARATSSLVTAGAGAIEGLGSKLVLP